MLILSRVCAEFRNGTGAVVFRVTPSTRLTFQEAPEEIREDPLFQLLLKDGSVEAVVSAESRKALEAEPMKGAEPSGRRKARKEADPSENHLTNAEKEVIMEKT